MKSSFTYAYLISAVSYYRNQKHGVSLDSQSGIIKRLEILLNEMKKSGKGHVSQDQQNEDITYAVLKRIYLNFLASEKSLKEKFKVDYEGDYFNGKPTTKKALENLYNVITERPKSQHITAEKEERTEQKQTLFGSENKYMYEQLLPREPKVECCDCFGKKNRSPRRSR